MYLQANMGDLDTPSGRRSLVAGNLTLLQVQALIVSFVASLVSFVLGLMSREDLATIRRLAHAKPLGSLVQSKLAAHWNSPLHRQDGGYAECLLVLAAGMLAASVNSLLLGALVSGLVIACRILRINPGPFLSLPPSHQNTHRIHEHLHSFLLFFFDDDK
jgi:solute carrier family 41